MLLSSANKILNQSRNKKVVIIGCGKNGRELTEYLCDAGINVIAVADNNSFFHGRTYRGIPICPIYESVERGECFIITVEKYRRELFEQLLTLGVDAGTMLIYYAVRDRDYFMTLSEDEIIEDVKDMFREHIGYDMDWNSPKTYNETINWEKVNCQDPQRARLADKYLVKEYVADKIGKKYIIPTLFAWDNAKDIDFNLLPSKCVLKVNNGSGMNIIFDKDLNGLYQKYRNQLDTWMKNSFAFQAFELHYSNTKPMIICEEYIDMQSRNFIDCKIYCFHDKPYYIQCIRDEHKENARARFYDLDWNVQDFNHGYPNDEELMDKPEYMDEILQLTRVLCKGHKHVRVDWIISNTGSVYFTEMTFSSWAGLKRFVPDQWDVKFGELMNSSE